MSAGSVARSVAAVVVGYLIVSLAAVGTAAWLFASPNDSPTAAAWTGAVAAQLPVAVLAGAAVAFMAGRAEARHGLALTVLLGIVAVGSIALATAIEPLWYKLVALGLQALGIRWGSSVIERRARRSFSARA